MTAILLPYNILGYLILKYYHYVSFRVIATKGRNLPCVPGVFSMDEDSLSRDCEPFFESDGEEESTDGMEAVSKSLDFQLLFKHPPLIDQHYR